MKIITILLGTDEDDAPFVQVIPSDGIDPEDGAKACWRAMDGFRAAAMEAEIQRRIEAVPVKDAEEDGQ